MVDRILVPFEGEGAGTGELSWGQREMWEAIRKVGSSLALGGVSPLAAGMTVADVGAVLRFVTSRHQSLRTRVEVDADGVPRQVVATAGQVPLEVVDVEAAGAAAVAASAEDLGAGAGRSGGRPGARAAGADDPMAAAVAAAVRDRFHDREFDYADEWPVRMAVIRRRGAVTHLVAMYCHLAVDGGGVEALIADLAAMDAGSGRATGPVRGMPPLEQARRQRSPAGRRQNDVTLRYWEQLLRTVPTRQFPLVADPGQPRYRDADFDSPALYLAVHALAARTGLDSSAVLLAAVSVALARVTGVNPTVLRLVVSNRFRPGFAASVATVSHPGMCAVDVAGISVEQVVLRAWQGGLAAYKNAYYDPIGRDELIGKIRADRGGLDLGCYINDRRSPAHRDLTGPVPTAADIRAARPRSTMRWRQRPVDPASDPLFVHVNDSPDSVDLRISVDTHCLSAATAEAFLRELDEGTVAAALTPGTPTGL